MLELNCQSVGTRPRILIIDDEESVRMALRTILQGDYDILEASSAEAALELLKQQHADLVTLDVLMPGRSGLETLRSIRESKRTNDVPVIMITGHASLDSACEALRLGASDYLQKPFGIDELKTSVRRNLGRHEAEEHEASAPLEEVEDNPLPIEDAPATRPSPGGHLEVLGKASAAFVHDLASPLQVLTILNSLCAQRLAPVNGSSPRDAELLEVVEQMEQLLAWAAELVKGWQTIAVPGALAKEKVDVDGLLDRVVDVVRPYAKLNSVTLNRAALPQKMQVVGDRIQLERALVNISLNGIKASTDRGRSLEISAISFNNYHVFRFADTGKGFSPERMKEVLNGDPFLSTSKTRRGLGIFIADWIAVNHGGKLQFICEQGLGTTVEFFLPTP